MNRLIKKNFLFIITTIFSFLKAILSIYFAFMLKTFLEYFQTGTKNEIYHQIVLATIFLGVYISVELLYNFFEKQYIKTQIVCLKSQTIESVLQYSIPYFNNKHSGEYLSILTNDIKALEDDFYGNIFESISMVVGLCGSVLAMIYLNPILGSVSILSSLVALIIPATVSNKVSKFRGQLSKKQDYLVRKTKGFLEGFETIKTYDVEELVLQDYIGIMNEVERYNQKLQFMLKSSATIGKLMGYFVFFVIIFTGLFLSIKNQLSFAVLLACIQLSNNLIHPIVLGIQIITKIRSTKYIREKFKIPKHEQKLEINTIPISFNNSIELEDVSFSYDNELPILSNISMKIEKGKKYAIIGESGSGKSTLGKIIMGVFSQYKGKILFDGEDISKYTSKAIVQLFSVINQSTFLFDDTILKNISFYRTISKDKIHKVLTDVQLTKFIDKETETIVGENGILLSGGEKQRISLARAFVNESPIILMDEATSQLDEKNMLNIENIVTSSSRTVITITHRLSREVLSKYDKIYVISHGKIFEQGTYEELMICKGLLYNLHATSEN